MNGIVRSALRLKSLVAPAKLSVGNVHSSRALLSTIQRKSLLGLPSTASSRLANNSHRHPCACVSCRFNHNKAEKELVEFLAEEIVAEKKALKLKTIPTEVEGFKVALDGSEVTLHKIDGDDNIKITFNINHTVDANEEPSMEISDDNPDVGDFKSKPNFDVDIKRGKQTLTFSCSFNTEPGASGASDEYNDIFGIDEISLYEGELTEKVYSVNGEIIDGYLYDLLMNLLEEKGISNDFAEKIIELSTSYEHTAYIGLLEGLSKFTSK